MPTTPRNATAWRDSFDEIAAAFDDHVVCEVKTKARERCRRPARYHARFHDCSSGLMCSAHLRRFLRQAQGDEVAQCNRCARMFACLEDAVTVVEL